MTTQTFRHLTSTLSLTLALSFLSTHWIHAQPATTARPGGKLSRSIQVSLEKVADGFADPVNVVSPRDGSGRLFVVERPGVVKIVDKDGQVLKRPFLDIKETVVSSFLEQGLYDLEFHPDFKNNRKFWFRNEADRTLFVLKWR